MATPTNQAKEPDKEKEEECAVPTVRIRLVQDVCLIPNECVTAKVQILLAEGDKALPEIQMVDVVFPPSRDSMVQVSLVNHLGITQKLEKGTEVSRAQPVEEIKEVDKEVTVLVKRA